MSVINDMSVSSADPFRPNLSKFCAPLINRIKRGEGGIVVLCALLVFFKAGSVGRSLSQIAFGILFCLSLYVLNDIVDCIRDIANPKKIKFISQSYRNHRHVYLMMWFALVGFLLVSMKLAKPLQSLNFEAVIVSELACLVYSMWLKQVPVLDVVVVGLCGAAIVAVFRAPPEIVVATGLMTAIAHVYQTREDARADALSFIKTNAALSIGLQRLEIFTLSAGILVVGAVGEKNILAILSLALLLVFFWFPDRRGWMTSRVLFLLIFIELLY